MNEESGNIFKVDNFLAVFCFNLMAMLRNFGKFRHFPESMVHAIEALRLNVSGSGLYAIEFALSY